MKIVLRVVGPLFVAVGLFCFAQGTGLLTWPHNAAMVDCGAGIPWVSALSGSDGGRCSRSPRFMPGRSDSYATLIIGCVIQARIPMPRCTPPDNRGDDTAKETQP
jgi:hypothetical protein